ncbi:predicted protein [Phaeodactylum tricornutum CCAP 1055/1]|uniref:Uncharacterized protein n=1 Tax=Phaeodactylum tricornutum (strain CCAP 1055/1) TaxID=556484 RepID=B7FZF2_PHATC|nr:predicted protein [Phaeodactylum tricornutum CCAP 1055/1]EEC48531.1 predicted protein [Phaeodactylum tricornutum CCAP 1055/1]|eukprot:XP_002180340.1 predicted protein [Phaeodactylum tricornutum CCAP 1055/1]
MSLDKDNVESTHDVEVLGVKQQSSFKRRYRNASKSRSRLNDEYDTATLDDDELTRAFQHQSHSLRVSASNVAAMTGFHPWKNLPELAMNLVYQGRLGQALLRKDALLLGLQLTTEEQVLRDLAQQSGVSTQKALQSILQVKDGSKKVESVELAAKLKQRVLYEAVKSGKLNKEQLKTLQEGTRSAVDTGYGTHQEDDALNLYEKQCGWEVRERNAEIRNWPFARREDIVPQLETKPGLPTVLPMRPASSQWSSPTLAESDLQEVALKRAKSLTGDGPVEFQDVVSNTSFGEGDDTVQHHASLKGTCTTRSPSAISPNNHRNLLPFFSIVGSVDGLREELFSPDTPCTFSTEFGADLALRTVIVECKHRMRKVHIVPPLYEQIQTIAYCLMYEVSEADHVQVLRQDPSASGKGSCTFVENNTTLDAWVASTQNQGKSAATLPTTKPMVDLKPTLTTYRVSLNDAVMQHQTQWRDTVLPRLRSFVEAVYAIRASDDKRYRLLVAVSLSTAGEDAATVLEAWTILHKECPWLESCNTAFSR